MKLDSPFNRMVLRKRDEKFHPFGWAGGKLLNINHRNRYKISIGLIVLLNKMCGSVTQGQLACLGVVACSRQRIPRSLIWYLL